MSDTMHCRNCGHVVYECDMGHGCPGYHHTRTGYDPIDHIADLVSAIGKEDR